MSTGARGKMRKPIIIGGITGALGADGHGEDREYPKEPSQLPVLTPIMPQGFNQRFFNISALSGA